MLVHRPRNLIFETSTPSSINQVAPPARRDAGENLRDLIFKASVTVENMRLNSRSVDCQSGGSGSFFDNTIQDNQLIASGLVIDTNCWMPRCLEFFGLQSLMTACGAANDSECGSDTSFAVILNNSPGRSRPKNPVITNAAKLYHRPSVFLSTAFTANKRDLQTIATSKGSGNGIRNSDGLSSSQAFKVDHVLCSLFFSLGLRIWTNKTACFATLKDDLFSSLCMACTNWSNTMSISRLLPSLMISCLIPSPAKKFWSAVAPSNSLRR